MAPPLILASTSATRRAMLTNAGIDWHGEAPRVDEEEAKRGLRAEGVGAMATAQALAEMKAVAVSRRFPGALVLGADSVLECGDTSFDKPPDLAHARAQLLALRGRTHVIWSAACVASGGGRIWHHNAKASLTMRPFSEAALDAYLTAAGTDVLGSVGAYRVEGPAVQLFSKIEGDWFTILGLPLLPLLEFLRGHGIGAP